MNELFYAVYSPSLDKWRDESGDMGAIVHAEKFSEPNKHVSLCGDERWVGPIAEGEHK